jgi:hypothetical protein
MPNKLKRPSWQNRKRSVLFVLATAFQLTVLAVATATQAFAQLSGEMFEKALQEMVGGQQLRLQGTYSEARNGGHLLSVWKGGITIKCGCRSITAAPSRLVGQIHM